MEFHACTQPPFSIHGLLGRREPGAFWRLPDPVIDTVSENVSQIARRASGGRVRFRTDARTLHLRMGLKSLEVAQCMPLCGSAGADVFLGRGAESRYLGFIAPEDYQTRVVESRLELPGELEQVTINLPRNEPLDFLEIGVEEGARLLPPLPYRYEKPVVFYGSSITEGGAASRPGNAYTSLVCRRLDCDYINLGFARSARGEPAMARFLAGLPMSVLVLDYDHNAPTVEALRATHAPFFRTIRATQPSLPVLILSRPNFFRDPEDSARRREVILDTCQKAWAQGDRNVQFLDGETLLAGPEPSNCTVDGIHPNDGGFLRMAERIQPVLQQLLEEERAAGMTH